MACPTCDATLQHLGVAAATLGRRVWWCPRCGTLVARTDGHTEVEAPKLVERCRAALGLIRPKTSPVLAEIRESINLPENRR